MSAKVDTTTLENQMMLNIANSEYNEVNGHNPQKSDETITWYYPEYLSKNMETNQVKGVVTSLVKKGLVCVQEDEDDNQIWLTNLGFEVYKNNLECTKGV